MIHLVQALTRFPGATVSHWRLGCCRLIVACMEWDLEKTRLYPLPQILHALFGLVISLTSLWYCCNFVNTMEIVITLLILLFSAVIHEVCHGIMALRLGDDTAKLAGRLTLNPIPHLDPFASVLLPLFLVWAGSPIIFGAAKPVPVNFFNLRNMKRDMALVSLAGPGSNFILALIFAIPIRMGLADGGIASLILMQAVVLNLILGIFNLLPIPPLDGSKIFASFLPSNMMYRILEWERFGFLIIIFLLFTGIIHSVLLPVLNFFSQILLGFSII